MRNLQQGTMSTKTAKSLSCSMYPRSANIIKSLRYLPHLLINGNPEHHWVIPQQLQARIKELKNCCCEQILHDIPRTDNDSELSSTILTNCCNSRFRTELVMQQ